MAKFIVRLDDRDCIAKWISSDFIHVKAHESQSLGRVPIREQTFVYSNLDCDWVTPCSCLRYCTFYAKRVVDTDRVFSNGFNDYELFIYNRDGTDFTVPPFTRLCISAVQKKEPEEDYDTEFDDLLCNEIEVSGDISDEATYNAIVLEQDDATGNYGHEIVYNGLNAKDYDHEEIVYSGPKDNE